VAGLVVLLLGNGGDTTGGETGCAGTDEFGETADELELGAGCDDAKLVLEQVGGLGQVLEGIPRCY